MRSLYKIFVTGMFCGCVELSAHQADAIISNDSNIALILIRE